MGARKSCNLEMPIDTDKERRNKSLLSVADVPGKGKLARQNTFSNNCFIAAKYQSQKQNKTK